ncbi:MAG: hypothetical protein K2X28_08850 [Alphaproteobacteria bacterium]|nr:hypothetical protein [Alphaproteobacteria bacterium]
MKQKAYKISFFAFPNFALLSSKMTVALVCLGGEGAKGDDLQVPGLAIARYALPSIEADVQPLNPTGTSVGAKVSEFKKALQGVEIKSASLTQSTRELYEKAIAEINKYYTATGEIEAKLQPGTTPANPKLVELRNRALQQLDQIAHTIGTMNGLIVGFSQASQQVKAVSSSIQTTLQLPGAVDEDHANLLLMSGELKQLEGVVSQILSIINTNTQRQNEWLTAERVRFATLSSAIDKGRLILPSQGLAIESVFPKPEPLPVFHSHEEGHPRHKHSQKHPSRSLKSAHGTSQPKNILHSEKPELNSEPLKPSVQPSEKATAQPLEKKESESKTDSLLPLPQPQPQPQPIPLTESSSREAPSPSVAPSAHEDKPLPKVTVPSRPKVQPLPAEGTPPLEEEKKAPPPSQDQENNGVTPSSDAALINNRSSLGGLEPNQNARSHKWTLFSAAKRGLKNPTDVIEIISVGDGERGHDVKNLLVEMGISPEQIKVLSTKAEEGQIGKVFIFSK